LADKDSQVQVECLDRKERMEFVDRLAIGEFQELKECLVWKDLREPQDQMVQLGLLGLLVLLVLLGTGEVLVYQVLLDL